MGIYRCRPAVKDYLWGGDRLIQEWNIKTKYETAAEAWVLSCHPDGPCVIEGGEYDGRTLAEVIQELGREVLGTDATAYNDFPILIKLIDAKKDLSIQVHPSDDYALEHEHQYGKTEAWYILDAKPGASLYYGFREEISAEEFADRIRKGTLTEVLNRVGVKKGDMFFIPPGTLHAIGSGILLAEIQQNSNVTYRVYDYDRKDAAGNKRELHIDKALEVTDRKRPVPAEHGTHLVSCAYFTVDRSSCTENGGVIVGITDENSFTGILVIDGEGELALDGESEVFECSKGDSFFVTAGSGEWRVRGSAELLVTTV